MGECGRGLGICVEGSLVLARKDFIPYQGILNQRFYLHILHWGGVTRRSCVPPRVWSINQLGGREASFSFLYSIPFQHIANDEMGFFPDATVVVCGSESPPMLHLPKLPWETVVFDVMEHDSARGYYLSQGFQASRGLKSWKSTRNIHGGPPLDFITRNRHVFEQALTDHSKSRYH